MRTHGTESCYVHGCRLDECRKAANAATMRRRKRRQTDIPDAVHGTNNGYKNYGCRCGDCREANRKSMAEYRNSDTGRAHYDGGVQWAVRRNDVDPPAYHHFDGRARAWEFFNSSMALAKLNLPDNQELWPELVSSYIKWMVES